MKLLLPDSVDLDLAVPGGVEAVRYAVDRPIPAEHTDAPALVVWGNPPDQLRDAAARLTDLRWVQTLAAGPDAVLAAGFAPSVVVTAGRGLHDATVTEHALALILAAARRLNLLVRAQVGHRWAGELGGLQPIGPVDSFRTLRGAHVVIWGFGGIAATLAPLLAALGAHVTGIARTAGERHGFPVVTTDAFPELLPRTDVLVMILPATPETAQALDATLLSLLPPHAWLVNVGRGSTVDEAALLDAVRAHRLGGAALDVFEPSRCHPTPGCGTSRTSSSRRTPPAAGRSGPRSWSPPTWPRCGRAHRCATSCSAGHPADRRSHRPAQPPRHPKKNRHADTHRPDQAEGTSGQRRGVNIGVTNGDGTTATPP